MRISTNQMFTQNTNSILSKQSATSKVLDQLSTGKRINTAGDDPVAAIGIDNLTQKNALVEQFMKNIDYAHGRLALSESKLGSAETLASSTREQVMRAMNGSLGDNERQMIADELKGTLDELLSIANSKDESGNYIFSGFNTEQQPFAFDATGNIGYSGDNGIRQAIIASGTTVDVNVPGDNAFMNSESALGDFRANYLASQIGEFHIQSAKITTPTPTSEDTYTFSMVGGNLEVRNSSSVLIHTEVSFDSNNSINFNGLEVEIEGVPANGDSFSITPQTTTSIFDTINEAISLIETPGMLDTPEGKSKLAQVLDNINTGVGQISLERGVTGNALKNIESHTETHLEEQIVNSSALSLLEDLDYASAITEYEKQKLALNAVSSVFSQVGSTSLFDYI